MGWKLLYSVIKRILTAKQLSLFKVIDEKLLRLYHYNTTLATQIEFTKGITPDSIYENLSELIPPSEVTWWFKVNIKRGFRLKDKTFKTHNLSISSRNLYQEMLLEVLSRDLYRKSRDKTPL